MEWAESVDREGDGRTGTKFWTGTVGAGEDRILGWSLEYCPELSISESDEPEIKKYNVYR